MGSNNSYERELKEARIIIEEMKIAAEAAKRDRDEMREDMKRIQAEKDAIQKKSDKFQKEKGKAIGQKSRVRQEKDRLLAEAREKDLERERKENEQRMENERIKAEYLELQERNRRIEKQNMDNLARRNEEESRRMVEREVYLQEEARRRFENGISEVEYPTGEEFQATRNRLQYEDGNVHLAITGISGCGKSSLVNALRGCPNSDSGDPNIARTGTTETTGDIERYIDPTRPWLAWYDVPGAGTLNLGIIFDCKRSNIPTFVVRTKADQHIRNTMDDDDSDDSDEERFIRARDKFITNTRQDFNTLLDSVGLPPQDLYIVSRKTLMGVIRGDENVREKIIDELRFVNHVLRAADEKRREELSQHI